MRIAEILLRISLFLFFLVCVRGKTYAQNQWQVAVGGAEQDWVSNIIQTTDKGYALVGRTLSFGAGNWDIYIVKLDSNLILEWTKTIGSPDWDNEACIIQTSDGGYAVTGWTLYGAGDFDLYIRHLS